MEKPLEFVEKFERPTIVSVSQNVGRGFERNDQKCYQNGATKEKF
jgi:hypothetical protein